MSPDLSALLGYPATFLATIAFVPQAWQSWRTRDLSGLRGLLILSFSHSLIRTNTAAFARKFRYTVCFSILLGVPLN